MREGFLTVLHPHKVLESTQFCFLVCVIRVQVWQNKTIFFFFDITFIPVVGLKWPARVGFVNFINYCHINPWIHSILWVCVCVCSKFKWNTSHKVLYHTWTQHLNCKKYKINKIPGQNDPREGWRLSESDMTYDKVGWPILWNCALCLTEGQ